MGNLPFPGHHRAALGTFHFKAGDSLLVRYLVAARRTNAEPSGAGTEAAATATLTAAATLPAT